MPRTPAEKRPTKPLNRVRDSRHGTSSGYYYHGCRCDKCREFAYENGKKTRERRHSEIRPEDHGKLTTYTNANCRCEPCTAAASAAYAAKPKRKSYKNFVDFNGLA